MPSAVPSYRLPNQNRQMLLTRRPDGIPQASDFTLSNTAVPAPDDGEFLVRNIYLSADPAQRGWASAEANYSAPVALGAPMRALAVGVVVESRNADVVAGTFLYGWFGWQDYALAKPQHIFMIATEDLPLDAFACLLGINGLTAWIGLTRFGQPHSGETLVVSTAAGSVGSFVGQIGRSLGCRTIGLTGDDAKVVRCTQRYGYDVAINYRTTDLAGAVRQAAPDGVDVYFDNTGGSILDAVLRQMRIGGRIAQCGTAANSVWTPPPTGPRNEREIMTRRLVWSGFVIMDHASRFDEAAASLAQMYRNGAITYDVDLAEGIEAAAGAIAQLYAGENTGKKLIYVG